MLPPEWLKAREKGEFSSRILETRSSDSNADGVCSDAAAVLAARPEVALGCVSVTAASGSPRCPVGYSVSQMDAMRRTNELVTDEEQASDSMTYAWSAHPAREQPGRAAVGAAWILAVAIVLYATTFNVFWSVFAVIFLLAALGRFFFPSRFVVDDEGLTASSRLRTQRIAWSKVQRFVHDERGGLLSDRSEPSRLDAYRGVHVLFGRSRKQAVQAIRACLQRARSGGRPVTTTSDGESD